MIEIERSSESRDLNDSFFLLVVGCCWLESDKSTRRLESVSWILISMRSFPPFDVAGGAVVVVVVCCGDVVDDCGDVVVWGCVPPAGLDDALIGSLGGLSGSLLVRNALGMFSTPPLA